MKTLAYFMVLSIMLLLRSGLSAQPGHTVVKTPKVNIPRIVNPPQVKIHANSNSVFRAPKTSTNQSQKNLPKKDEVKKENTTPENKQKKGKKQKK